MALVREYNRQFGTPNLEVGGRRAGGEDFGAGVAEGVTRLGHTGQQAAAMLDKYAEDTATADAQIKVLEATKNLDAYQKELERDAVPGESIAPKMEEYSRNYFASLEGQYEYRAARDYVTQKGAALTNAYFKNGAAFDVELSVRHKSAQRKEASAVYENAVAANPSSYSDVKKVIQSEVEGEVGIWSNPMGNAITKVATQEYARELTNRMAWSAAMSTVADPSKRAVFAGAMKGTAVAAGQDSIIDGVLKREGGYVANDGGRGPTKFGINGEANGLSAQQVSNLTEGQARQLYQQRWETHGIGDIPAAAQAIVMDGVVNHRSDFAKNLVTAAKGGASVGELADMRKAEYERLITANPEKYGQYRKSWMARVDETAKQTAQVEPDAEAALPIKGAPEWYDDLTPEQRFRFGRMVQEQTKRERSIADAALKKTIQDQETYFMQHGQLPPNLLRDRDFIDPVDRAEYNSFVQAANIVTDVINSPADKQREKLEKLQPTLDPGGAPGLYTKQVQIAERAEKLLKGAMKLRTEDQVAFAYQQKFSLDNPIEPIDKFDVDNVIPALTQRMPQAKSISDTYAQPLKPLMESEAKGMRQYVDGLPSALEKQQYMSGLANSLDVSQYNALMKQVWRDDNAMRFTGQLMRTPGFSQGGQRADAMATTIMLGRDALQYKPKGPGGEEERGFKGVMPDYAQVRNMVGSHLTGVKIPESSVGAVAETVMAHYIGSMLQKGTSKNFELGDKDDGNKAMFRKSMEAVIGTVSVMQDGSKVIREFGVNDAQFQKAVRDRVGAIDPNLRGYGLAIHDGEANKYDVKIGNNPIFVIDMNAPVPRGEPVVPQQAGQAAPQPDNRRPTTQSRMQTPWVGG